MESLSYTILISVDFAQDEILRAKVWALWQGCFKVNSCSVIFLRARSHILITLWLT